MRPLLLLAFDAFRVSLYSLPFLPAFSGLSSGVLEHRNVSQTDLALVGWLKAGAPRKESKIRPSFGL